MESFLMYMFTVHELKEERKEKMTGISKRINASRTRTHSTYVFKTKSYSDYFAKYKNMSKIFCLL